MAVATAAPSHTPTLVLIFRPVSTYERELLPTLQRDSNDAASAHSAEISMVDSSPSVEQQSSLFQMLPNTAIHSIVQLDIYWTVNNAVKQVELTHDALWIIPNESKKDDTIKDNWDNQCDKSPTQ